MRNVSLIIFCALLIIVIITLVDAQQQKSKKAAVPTNKPARAASNAKVKSAQNLSKGRQAATKKPSTTIKKRRATTKKSTTKGILKAFSKSNFALTTVFDEDAPDIESGTDCYDSCFPNSTFITGAGKIRNPEQYGRFLDFGGKTYLLGKNAVDWKENWKTCCALGMTPMIFVSQDELTEFARGFEKYASNKEIKYWTGGFKHELNNMWSWCTKDSPDPMDENLVTELSKEKDKSDNNCVSMSTSVGGSITLTNYLCNITMATDSNSSIYLACESVDKTPDDLLGDRSKCTTRCNATRSCKRNETLFKFNKNNEMILENRYKYGRWVSKCGRYFLFSNKTNTYDEARDRCCALGMELLSIKTAAKRKCLSKVTRDYPDTTGEFWTSGTDLDCNGGYRWCSVDRAFLKHEVLWGADEPNQKRGDCVTVRTNSNAKLTTLQTDLCPAKKRYICEVRQSGTTVETVQKECVDLFGLTNAEVEGLDNISNYTNKMKCYLKCIGDNLGMLVNGVLQEGNVMRLMEKSNEKGDMDKGYQAINECKNKSIPDDECESAYRMYKCGKEQAPVVFGKMVVYKEVTSEDNTAPVDMAEPRTCKLKMSTRCQINSLYKNMFKNSLTTPEGGSAVTGIDGKTWFKSNYSKAWNYTDAYMFCCHMGMHLPVSSDYEEFVKLYDFLNGTTQDNFYDETQTDKDTERWCTTDIKLDARMSDNNFTLDKESSFLYSHKSAPKYKLISLRYSRMYAIEVNYFYCQPEDESE